jgi:hypothetical protein
LNSRSKIKGLTSLRIAAIASFMLGAVGVLGIFIQTLPSGILPTNQEGIDYANKKYYE